VSVASPTLDTMAIAHPDLPAPRTWTDLPNEQEIRAVVGAPNFARGAALARAGRVRWVTSDPGHRVLFAAVHDDSGPRQALVHVGGGTGVRSAGRCTCPRPVNCEHVAAILIAARAELAPGASRTRAAVPDGPPAWERRLVDLFDEGGSESGAIPIGLLFEPVASRNGAAPALRIRLRPVLPGRRGWVRSGIGWRELSYSWRHPHQSRAHREALHLLHQAHLPSAGYAYGEPAVHLDEFGPALWPLLRGAAEAGVAFVDARAAAGSVTLADDPAVVALELRRDARGNVTAATVVDVPGVDGAGRVTFVGRPAHGVAVDLGEPAGPPGLVLAPLGRPLTPKASGLLSAGELHIPAADVERFLAEYYPALSRVVAVRSGDGSLELPTVAPPRLALRLTYANPRSLTLEWAFLYESGGGFRRVPLSGDSGPARDHLAEQRLLREVRLPEALRAGPEAAGPAPRAEMSGVIVAIFTQQTVPDLEAQGVVVEVIGTPGEYRHSESTPIIRVSATDSTDADWFDLGVTVEIDGEVIPFERLFVALAHGEHHLLLDSGTYFRIDRPELDRLRQLIEEAQLLRDRESRGLRLSVYQASLWEELAALGIVEEQSTRWAAAIARLLAGEAADPPAVPVGLEASLRPYQLDGYRWLSHLWDAGLGGILADDMGLGKTLQTLATIMRAREDGRLPQPALVVAPASVVGNWVAEAGRFTPGLTVVAITETERRAGRALAERVAGADVVVTSYQLFRIDNESFQAVTWSALILDEAQFVKNHQARTYQCARRLAAPFKLAITGTPLENSLMDLWSLLSIVAPGLFPDPKAFTEACRKPIERGGAPELLATVHRRIRPFIRRRTKEQVAADLPPKQEQILRVELHPRHRRIYDTHLQRERQKVLSLLDDVQKNRFTILRSLTLLRQLSLDASLVDDQYSGVTSAKIEVFLEQLAEVIAGGHRALVFSQFTTFLGRVRDRLGAAGIEYCYLDGRTRNRSRRVEEFKTGSAPVFLISLKAGGFGLNLTEADYCFVLDPWWNPAAEAQAVDRTHRIGQDKHVMVYRLVAEQTIEEKVLALQARKRDLFDAVIEADGELAALLSARDIRDLLAV